MGHVALWTEHVSWQVKELIPHCNSCVYQHMHECYKSTYVHSADCQYDWLHDFPPAVQQLPTYSSSPFIGPRWHFTVGIRTSDNSCGLRHCPHAVWGHKLRLLLLAPFNRKWYRDLYTNSSVSLLILTSNLIIPSRHQSFIINTPVEK